MSPGNDNLLIIIIITGTLLKGLGQDLDQDLQRERWVLRVRADHNVFGAFAWGLGLVTAATAPTALRVGIGDIEVDVVFDLSHFGGEFAELPRDVFPTLLSQGEQGLFSIASVPSRKKKKKLGIEFKTQKHIGVH